MGIALHNDNEIILVDDDDIEIMIARRNVVASRLRNPLVTYHSGPEFIDHMGQVKEGHRPMPALVLLDLRMPKMDGFEVLQRIRCQPAFGEVPVIVMFSNSDAPSDMRRAAELGADDYLIKPASSDEYIAVFNEFAATR